MRTSALLVVALLAVSPAPGKRDRCPEGQERIFTGECVSKCEKGTVSVIGGGCTAAPRLVKAEPTFTSTDQPDDYRTSYERSAEEEETVVKSFTVKFILEADGKVGRAEVSGSGGADLREVLIQRVRMRVYAPATVDGTPVAVYMTSTYSF
jgi:hypothetical protein